MTHRSGSRRRGRLSLHEQHLVFAGAGLVVLAGFIVAFMFIEPPPPSTVTIATGGPGGAYHTFAERYQRRLAAEDIELRLIPTSGSVENIGTPVTAPRRNGGSGSRSSR